MSFLMSGAVASNCHFFYAMTSLFPYMEDGENTCFCPAGDRGLLPQLRLDNDGLSGHEKWGKSK